MEIGVGQNKLVQQTKNLRAYAQGPWFFIHPRAGTSPLEFVLKGTNQINVENLAVFNGIADVQKVAHLTLSKGINVAGSAVFGTSKIKTSRGPMAINSAIHFLSGATYQFRIAQPGQTTWAHLSGTNMTGTQEVEPSLNRHIDGYISYQGGGTFTFPVGNGDNQFSPLTARGNEGQTITTTWISGDPNRNLDSTDIQSAHNRASVIGDVKHVYPHGQWDWHVRANGTGLSNENAPTNVAPLSQIEISVTIPADIDVIGGNSSNLRLVGWNGSAWEELTNTSITSGKISASISKVFSAITLGTVERGALPVKLIMFTVTKEAESSILAWQTSEEVNSEIFEIERSTNGTDWSKLGSTLANGNTQDVSKYRYVDRVPALGSNLYRLKMIDNDNTFAYSHIIALNFEEGGEKVFVYPNPVSDVLKIQANYDWQFIQRVDIYNRAGKVMYTSSSPEKSISVKNLPVGNYILSLVRKDGSKKQFTIVVFH